MIYKTKADVLAQLPYYIVKFNVLRDDIEQIDHRIVVYIESNLNLPDNHNFYEILGVFRFIDNFDKYDFKISKVKQFFKFYESMCWPSDAGMQSFPLTAPQAFQFANIFGWYKDDGSRLIQEALLFCPRKYSKTTSIASLAIYDLLFGDNNAQAYVSSNSFAQSSVCFKIISEAVKHLDPMMKSFRRNRQLIYSIMPNRTSFVQCLSSNADTLDGLNASTVILDEYAAATSASVRNVLQSSMGMRKNPLTVVITTASTLLEGPFVSMLEVDKKILRGEVENDSVFPFIFEPDEGDDWTDEAVWSKVQPHMGITVRKSFYDEYLKKAKASADDLVEFKTKLLNIFTLPSTAQWIKPSMISRNLTQVNLSEITTRPMCMVGVDLSVSDDMSAVAYGLYDSINKSFVFKVDYYIPHNTIETHSNKELYQRWIDQGFLKECGDEVIDYEQIARDILNNSKYLNILSIGYDSYKSKDLVNYLKASGVKCLQAVKQVYSTFTAPVESFEMSLAQNKIKIDNNPITQWMFNNVVIDVDKMENKKPIKSTASKKIDGVITILESLFLFMNWKR